MPINETSAHRIEAVVEPNGGIVLDHLPFAPGQPVIITVVVKSDDQSPHGVRALEGLPVTYDQPFAPVASSDWDAAR